MHASKPFLPLKSSYGDIKISNGGKAVIGATVHQENGVNWANIWSNDNFISRRVAIINSLLGAGADVERRSMEKHTALDYASSNGSSGWEKVSSILRQQREGLDTHPQGEGILRPPWMAEIVDIGKHGGYGYMKMGHVNSAGIKNPWYFQELRSRDIMLDNGNIVLGCFWYGKVGVREFFDRRMNKTTQEGLKILEHGY